MNQKLNPQALGFQLISQFLSRPEAARLVGCLELNIELACPYADVLDWVYAAHFTIFSHRYPSLAYDFPAK